MILAEITLTFENISAVIAVVSGLAAWLILPKRVDDLDERVKKLEARDEKLTKVETTLDIVKDRVEKIAEKMNIA